MLPLNRRPPLLHEIAGTLGAYLSGTLRVAGILMLLYSLGFALAGIPYWPVLGVLCGFANLIPVVGALGALALSLLWAYGGTGNLTSLFSALAVYVVVQGFEGFYLTPRLIGRRVQISPWAVFLSVLCGSIFFGPFGVIFAVPAVAVCAILWRRWSSPVAG